VLYGIKILIKGEQRGPEPQGRRGVVRARAPPTRVVTQLREKEVASNMLLLEPLSHRKKE